MAEPVAVVFSDAHLTRRTWKNSQVYGDSYFAFKQIVKFAIKHGLPLIGAGDLIDKRVNEPDPIVFLQEQLAKLNENMITFYYTQGQHEYDETPWLKLGASAVHIHKVPVDLGGLTIYGIDYQGADKLKVELDAIPAGVDVLIAHQVWADVMGDIALPQGSFADVPVVSLMITGDYHSHYCDTYEGKDGQELVVFSCGATYQCKIDEPDTHHFGVLMSDGTVKRQTLKSRKYDEWLINTEDEMEEFLTNVDLYIEGAMDYAADKGLPEQLHKPLWRIIFSHQLSDVPRRVAKIVDERAHLFWKEIPREREESKILDQVPDLKKGEALTLEVCLPQEINPEEEPVAYALATRLLDADDVELESHRWLKEMMDDGSAESEPESEPEALGDNDGLPSD